MPKVSLMNRVQVFKDLFDMNQIDINTCNIFNEKGLISYNVLLPKRVYWNMFISFS